MAECRNAEPARPRLAGRAAAGKAACAVIGLVGDDARDVVGAGLVRVFSWGRIRRRSGPTRGARRESG
jgi:hypothetical protein